VIVDAVDADAESIEDARRTVAAAGLTGQVRPTVRDASDPELERRYDLVTIFEALRDINHPVEALRAAHNLLGEDGSVVISDERVAERFTAPGDELERSHYGWSVLHCRAVGMLEENSAGTGAVIRPRYRPRIRHAGRLRACRGARDRARFLAVLPTHALKLVHKRCCRQAETAERLVAPVGFARIVGTATPTTCRSLLLLRRQAPGRHRARPRVDLRTCFRARGSPPRCAQNPGPGGDTSRALRRVDAVPYAGDSSGLRGSTRARLAWCRAGSRRCDARVPGPRRIPLGTTSVLLACARPEDSIGNEFGRAPDVSNFFVFDGSVMNNEAAGNAALTVVAPGRPHRVATESGTVSPATDAGAGADGLLVPD
jgi:Methyltransferase domain